MSIRTYVHVCMCMCNQYVKKHPLEQLLSLADQQTNSYPYLYMYNVCILFFSKFNMKLTTWKLNIIYYMEIEHYLLHVYMYISKIHVLLPLFQRTCKTLIYMYMYSTHHIQGIRLITRVQRGDKRTCTLRQIHVYTYVHICS